MAGPARYPMAAGSMASCLELFRLGWGTDRIATYWRISEAEALLRVNEERAQNRRLPSPYGGDGV